MTKLRGLKDRITHKDHAADSQADVSREDDNAFLHKTSHDTGADANVSDKPKEGGIKAVY